MNAGKTTADFEKLFEENMHIISTDYCVSLKIG